MLWAKQNFDLISLFVGLTGVMVACLSLVYELKEKRKRKKEGGVSGDLRIIKKTKELRFLQLLVFFVDQLGLEPRTSRL